MLRFIDDIIGIWVGDPRGMEWKEFKKDVSNFGILTWTFEEPSKLVNFLDLTISIEGNGIVTKTYQKELNLWCQTCVINLAKDNTGENI